MSIQGTSKPIHCCDLFKNNRTELLLKFMEYIGVEPKETKQQTAESESEEQ